MKKAENIYNSVIRIHVLANSNDALDQELKIKVRDRILDFAKENFSEEYDKDQAEKAIKEKLPEIISLSEKSLEDAGCNDSVSATLSQEYYPTREYETLSLPAGEYLSLRVMIGEAKGENWWCVLFPPVCINSAVDTEDALANAGMEKKNILTVTGKKEYVYRF
ncbi:MAG: stage II sporulation protein R, partial [Clostridia bacterium]|nr:stage II sporulation protein R [Clostridia bacterium]